MGKDERPKGGTGDSEADLSVVIPCYRCADTIAEVVRTVREQTLLPRELVLVDDGSGDGTLAVLHALRERYGDDWLRVLSLERNLGPASARNAGWDAARGTYLAFLDSDDTWHARKVEIQLSWMLRHPEVVLTGTAIAVKGQSELDPCEGDFEVRASPIRGGQMLVRNVFWTPTVMLRRDLSQRFVAGRRYCEDELLWQEICLSGLGAFKLEHRLTKCHKALSGVGGLSGSLWKMQMGSLWNYRHLHRSGRISWVSRILAGAFSWCRFLRRLLIVAFRRRC